MSLVIAKALPEAPSTAEFSSANGVVVNMPAVFPSVSLQVPFDVVKDLIESALPPRRPTRNAPIHDIDPEIAAWNAASDESLRNCEFWE